MNHVPVLIQDLAVILFSAGLMTLLFKYLKQPVVLGYIVAGLIAGPHLFGGSWIGDMKNIQVWGEIGVIFLLFALGLEFSFKKLMTLGGTAVTGALVIVLGMMTLGFFTGRLLGWSDMNALFLGGMLSMSSTTIVFKALDDMGLRSQHFSSVVFSILIVEDLFAVALMVLLSTVAVSKSFEGFEMAESVGKLCAYLLFWFVTGIFLIPTFLKRIRKYLNDETMLVLALGLCLGMVMLAVYAGFSAALGAFVMGSVLAETVEAEKIERLVRPVKDLFGAIFFVSVGMMIDPGLLLTYWFPILLITCVVIFGQVFFASTGVLLSGQPLKVAVQSGFALAQIGEFAFIIASLGQSLKVTNASLYPIVVAVSVITIFLTPYLIRFSGPVYRWLDGRLPQRAQRLLDRYCTGPNTINHKSTWHELLRELGRIMLVYGITAIFISVLYLTYVSPLILEMLPDRWGRIVSLLGLLALIAPLLRAIMMKKNHSREFMKLWQGNRINRSSLVGLILLRILLCIGWVMFVIARLFTLTYGFIFGLSVIVILIFISSRLIKMQSIKLERHFLRNLTAREAEEERHSPIRKGFVSSLLARDLHLADFEVQPGSPSIGKMLKELDFRQRNGVNVVKIVRGEHHINIPGGNEHLFPYDKIVIAGTDEQIAGFRRRIEERNRGKNAVVDVERKDVTLEQFVVEPDSFFVGKSIRKSHIRDKGSCLIIAVERKGKSILNPDADLVFEGSDLVWVVGERERIEALLEEADRKKNAGDDWIVVDKP